MRQFKKRRSIVVMLISLLILIFSTDPGFLHDNPQSQPKNAVLSESVVDGELALPVLDSLAVKGRAPKTGYKRSQFSDGWAKIGDCDVRNIMMQQGFREAKLADDNCTVLSGILDDPYTGKTIHFLRGKTTSGEIQIDHVIALSNAWQTGAQQISVDQRLHFANDSLNLLAVDGPANQKKGDSDAASWLPSNKSYRCQYVARQIAVKRKYNLWVTAAEKVAMKRVLNGCGGQVLPVKQK